MSIVEVEVMNRYGLHTRPAASIVKTAGKFNSDIMLQSRNRVVNGKNVLSILTLGAEQGRKITISAKGDDASLATESLKQLFENKLGEEE